MINHILAASRVPSILEQKGIDIERNLLRISIDKDQVDVSIYDTEAVLKFDNWVFNPYEGKYQTLLGQGYVGTVIAKYDGIQFASCVSEEELSLIES